MYRLMLYYLTALYSLAIIFSFIKIIPYSYIDLLTSGLYLIFISYLVNQVFAYLFKVRPNYESQLITGTILALIVGPLPLLKNLVFLTILGVISMASKYLIAYKKQHIFNPAAIAVTVTAVAIGQGASWWIGDKTMLPFIAIGGLLMIRKLKRFNMIVGFVLSYAFFLSVFSFQSVGIAGLPDLLKSAFLSPPILFFTFVMLTEPITSPADRKLRLYFGIFCGFVYTFLANYLNVSYTLELSLLVSNLVFRIIRFSEKYDLVLQSKKEIAKSIWEFVFEPVKSFAFLPGQFLEWTLPHPHADSRGNRRYFTISSSPTESTVKLAVKIPEKASSFKSALNKLNPGDSIYATNLEGEFVLDKETDTKYVFVAGGIGITPFVSIIRYMLDKKLTFPIVLFYIARDPSEFAYKELLEKAEKNGVKTVYVISENPPDGWKGEVGRLNEEMIKKYVPDPASQLFYISGPQPMVMAYEEMLQKLGVKYKADFFPGYEETYSK